MGCDEMIEDLMARAARVAAELGIVHMMETPETLGYVGCCGAGGPEDLIPESVAFVLGKSGKD